MFHVEHFRPFSFLPEKPKPGQKNRLTWRFWRGGASSSATTIYFGGSCAGVHELF
jgi:hypothetical protein